MNHAMMDTSVNYTFYTEADAGEMSRLLGDGDHLFEGQAYFRSIADHGGPMLMDKRLVF